MARGRPIIGVDLTDRVDGPRALRRRVRIVLATLAGRLTIAQACAELGIGRTQFHKLRWRVLEGAVDGLRPRPRGRPPHRPLVSPEVQHLQARIHELEAALKTTALRSEIALTMPYLLDRAGRKKKARAAAARGAGRDTRRSREQHVRRACVGWAACVDGSTRAVATALGLSTRTLRRWAATRRTPDRGRPTHAITRAEAAMMRLAFAVHGPQTGVATLQAWCPSASRRAIDVWRRARRRAARRRLYVVRWSGPGRIWAADFSDAPLPIDGEYPCVLHVRDLASQQYLAALPVPRATADAVCDLLRALAATHQAPLVLKVDNGAAFGSRQLQAWAAGHGTALLYSPPACPRYNGSIEASIGALTTRAHHAAAAAGHPESWTCADVEAARLQANAHTSARVTRITAAERQRFQAHYGGHDHTTTRAQRRIAIAHTLQVLGYVSITRRADLVH